MKRKFKRILKIIVYRIFELARQYEREQIQKKFKLSPTISFNQISLEGNIFIGELTYINDFTRIDTGPTSSIYIGKHCAIGRLVHITSKTHDFAQPTTEENGISIKLIEANVKIGDYVWIGDKVTILPGVTIGDHSIIGAHSLVKSDVKPFEVVAGIPAKHIRFNSMHKKYAEFAGK